MMNLLTNLLYCASGWVIIFVVLSWIMAGFYPLMSRMLCKVTVEQAAFFILLYALIPLAAASVAMIVLSVPHLAFSLVADHCHGADCAPHGLQVALNSVQSVTVVSVLISALISVCMLIARQLLVSQNRLQALDLLAEHSSSSYKILDNHAALAWCVGLFRPQIYISRALAESLTPEQMQVILTHEQTHIRRKDNLRKWIVHWVTLAWPGRYKKRIRQELTDYTEQVCDLVAVEYHRETLGMSTVLEILKKCYPVTEQRQGAAIEQDFKTRVQNLKQAWGCNASKTTKLAGWLPAIFMSSLWLIFIIFTVRVGHPVLEWISV